MLYVAVIVFLGVIVGSQGMAVNVSLYGEALCPDTRDFVLGALDDALAKVGDIFTLHYVPWGNAILKKDGKFECQHGKMECVMNQIEACVLYYYKERSTYWPFFKCSFEIGEGQDMDTAEACAAKAQMNWDNISECYGNGLGHKLELMYLGETNELDPPHTYVPWVTIDGKHNTKAEGAMLTKVICDAYTGGDKPPACD